MKQQVNTFVKFLQEKNKTLALAESITCGLAAHQLNTVKGTNEVLQGSVVCYHESVKLQLMKIPKKTVERYSCESMEVTELLAQNLKKLIRADIHAAVTGLASSGGSECKGKPVGTVFLCVLYNNEIFGETKLFRGSPLEIKKKTCIALYQFIMKTIKDQVIF